LQAALQQVALKEAVERRRFETKVERRKRERDRKLRTIERELDTEIQRTQNLYKGMALFLPMLPPVLIGLAVYARRQRLEAEGITSERRC
jgi:ABC-2 type transport system permease protein